MKLLRKLISSLVLLSSFASLSAQDNLVDRKINSIWVPFIFDIKNADLDGVQLSAIFNMAHNVNGAQIAAIFNNADGNVNGTQISAIFNKADDVKNGVQITAIANIANDVNGAQVSIFNKAKNINGFQIGLVNIAESNTGFGLGLINLYDDGIKEVNVGYKTGNVLSAKLTTGTQNFFSILGVETSMFDEYFLLAGIGGRIVSSDKMALDVKAVSINSIGTKEWNGVIPEASLEASYNVFEHCSVYVAGNLDFQIKGYNEDFMKSYNDTSLGFNIGSRVMVKPSFGVGVKIR